LKNALVSPLRTGVRQEARQDAPGGQAMPAQAYAPRELDAAAMTAHLRGEFTPEQRAQLEAAGAPGGMDFFSSGAGGAGGTGSATDMSWRLGFQRHAGRPFELKTGAVIPGVLISAVNSDLSGALIAQVSQDVYDSATGRWLLIPRGSRLFGDYAGDVRFGQDRLFVSWKRIIFPDGSSITLGDMRGADQQGQSGFSDQVNNHFFRTFGSAVLMSLITAGTSYSVDRVNGSRSADEVSMQNEMTVALAQQLGEASMAILQKNLNIAPTIEIRSGYRFSVVVTKDLTFAAPYAPMAVK
jgi:type IV secretion system protein VirB10